MPGARGRLAACRHRNGARKFLRCSLLEATGWLDGTDRATEGTWIWQSTNFAFWNGAPVGASYTNWNPGEPNEFGNEDCLAMMLGGGWNDENCFNSYRGICESP